MTDNPDQVKKDIIDKYYSKWTSPGNEYKVWQALTNAVNEAYKAGQDNITQKVTNFVNTWGSELEQGNTDKEGITLAKYTICSLCDHFVEYNYVQGPGLAKYVHLDNGDKEHDHDAYPSLLTYPLDWWKAARPNLFKTYPDNMVGPNSIYYPGWTCGHCLQRISKTGHHLSNGAVACEPTTKPDNADRGPDFPHRYGDS